MADTDSTVGSGKTYPDLAAWEAASYGGVGAGDEAKARVFGAIIDWVELDDATPGTIIIEADPSTERHAGLPGTGAVLKASNFRSIIDVLTTSATEIRWLEFDGNGASAANGGIDFSTAAGSGTHTVHHCLIQDIGTRLGITTVDSCKIWRCVVWANGDNGIRGIAGTVEVYNCTIYANGADGITFFLSAISTVKNTASTDNTGDNIDNADTTETNYVTDGQAANNWTDAGSGDFSVKDVGSALYNAGTDLSSTGLLDIDVDIFGNPVTGTWDIGAAEFVEAATGVGRNVIIGGGII